MANPIIPSGQRIGLRLGEINDPVERARRQDEERRIQEDDEHFRRTGENRQPVTDYSPLVEDNPRNDIADDGDSYDEPISPYHRSEHSADGEWAEDTPTQIIDPDNPRTRRPNNTSQIREGLSSLAEREAYFRREREKEDLKLKELENVNRRKYNNSISGLETDDKE